jgi:flagellar FliJ protein
MTQALQTLLEHAERQRNEALALLLQAEEATRRLQQQEMQLLAYRDEYRQRQPGLGGHSVSIELLRSHHEFMQRLEQALAQQQGQMTLADNRLTARRAELLALETRVASVRKLMERRSHEQRRRSDRQEQRISDDAAQHATRNAGPLSAAWSASGENLPQTHH